MDCSFITSHFPFHHSHHSGNRTSWEIGCGNWYSAGVRWLPGRSRIVTIVFSIPPCEEEFLAKIRLLHKHADEPYKFLKKLHATALLDGMSITDCRITTHIIRIKAWQRTLPPSSRKRGTREGHMTYKMWNSRRCIYSIDLMLQTWYVYNDEPGSETGVGWGRRGRETQDPICEQTMR